MWDKNRVKNSGDFLAKKSDKIDDKENEMAKKKESVEATVRNIRRNTRKKYSAERKYELC